MASSDPLDPHITGLWEALQGATGEGWAEGKEAEAKALIRHHMVKLIEKVVQDSPTTKLVLAVQAALPQLTAMRDQARYVISKGEHSAAAIQAQGKLDRILQAHGELVLAAGPVEAHPGRHGHG